METEAKAKVVASVWEADFIQFLVALAVLPWSIWRNRLNSSYFINYAPKTDVTTFAFASAQTDVTTFAFASVSVLLL